MRSHILVLGLMGMLVAPAVSAQETNYQPYPMGERALGMGGAFAAMAGDPIATYYNPAGLVAGESPTLSGSLNVYGTSRRTIEQGGFFGVWEPDPENPEVLRPVLVDIAHKEFPPATIPISAVIVRRIGRRGADGLRPHAVAWTTMVPRASDLAFNLTETNDFDGDPDTEPDEHRIVFREADKLMLIGPSWAYRLTPRFSIGVSAFVAIRSYTYMRHHTLYNVDRSPDLSGIEVRELDITSSVYSGVFRLGGLWQLSPRWMVGLMVSLPSFQIHGEGSYALRDVETFSGGYEIHEDDNAQPNDFLPLEIRIGAAHEDPGVYAIALDVTFYGPANYDRFDLQPGWTGNWWVNRVERRAIANVNIGGEVIVAQHWPIRLGFFTDFSSAPEIRPSSRPALHRIHTFGGTFSVGYSGRGFDINVGVLGSIGAGHAQTLGPIVSESSPTFVATEAEERRLYFFISGANRAVERLFGRVVNRIEEGDEDEDEGEE